MKIWIIYILLYGILRGTRDPIKKSVLKRTNVMTALFTYTFLGFIMTAVTSHGVFNVTPYFLFLVFIKSAALFAGWLLSFAAIEKIPVSIYSLTDMSRVIFATLMGIVFFGDSVTLRGMASLLLIAAGLYFANSKKSRESEHYSIKYIGFAVLSCLLNAVSETLDKYIMSSFDVTSSALQFWLMGILAFMYFAYILIKKVDFRIKEAVRDPWIYVLSFSLVLGDRLLFIANSDPESTVTIMTLVKQSSAVISILIGKFVFKEKNILKKLVCAAVIIAGIMLAVL